ncbi:metallophosphoesterase family protein [Anaerophaga thermohalophila]|uniref:metallophosphoesterase family protein n=1 Tax=Anaerophaga thermohalophila TaxID=177400 RepID=UPI0002E49316|nr:metallophosphoesterase [Anaerophaga thermohalophila]
MKRIFLYTLAIVPFLFGCDGLIEYSPYQSGAGNLPDNINIKAVERLSGESSDSFQPFTIALIGDSHTYYDDFADQIDYLNGIDSIDFVVHNGDITLSGIYREFLWFHDISSLLKHPMITIIGNHDFLSNGENVYTEMFGPTNFVLDYNNCRFVFFDDIIWEKNVQDPDFEWLYNACNVKQEKGPDYVFVFAHIQPWDSSFSIGNQYVFCKLLEDNEVDLSIHGHTHSFFHGYRDGCEVPFLVTGDSTDREIVLLEIRKDTLKVTRQPI